MGAVLVSLNIATDEQILTGAWTGRKRRTGIGKQPVATRIETGLEQLAGDNICDLDNHGGADQAVYAYSVEDAQWWSSALQRPLVPGAFGENFTTSGLDLTRAVIGERWAVGTAVFEVSVPRIPCRVFAGFWDVPDLIKRFTQQGRPGAYLRIHRPGSVGAGDEIDLIHRPGHGVTIEETFRALTGDHSLAKRLLEAPELPVEARARAQTWLTAAAR